MSFIGPEYALGQVAKTQAMLQKWNAAELSKTISTISCHALPDGCGNAYASLSNGVLGIWYTLSGVERTFAPCVSLHLFSVRKNGERVEFAPITGICHEKLPYLRGKLLPALTEFFTKNLGWVATTE